MVALTPVAALMFRYNNPDALLALLLTAATYATMRGIEKAQTKWLVLAGALVGFGFITKMMQAFLILPVMAVVYLLAAPTGWWRRVWQVAVMGVSVVIAGGWWVAAVALTPAADRPYVGGSQDNSILNLIFDYNGFGRLTGNESGSVGGGPAGGTSMWGATGWTRLFNESFGNMMSWLLPGALVIGAVLLVLTLRNRRTDRERAGLLLWGGSLVAIGLTISMAQGIIHPYYAVALAPPLGALVGIATMGLWERRNSWTGRVGLAAGLGVTVVWSAILLGRTSDWFPALRPVILVAGVLGVAAILALPLLHEVPKVAIGLVAVLGLGAALAAPLFSTVATAATPHAGAIPSVTPTAAGGFGGPGFPGGRGAGGFAGGGLRGGVGGGLPGGTGTGGFPGGGTFPGAAREDVPRRGRWDLPRRGRWHGHGWRVPRPRCWDPGRPGRWSGGRFLERQPVQRRAEQAVAVQRQSLHLGGSDGELEQRGGLPVGQRRAHHGDRWLQRDGSGAHTAPVRDVRLRGQNPLLHCQWRWLRRRWLRRRWLRWWSFRWWSFRRRPERWFEQQCISHHLVGRVPFLVEDGRRRDGLRPDLDALEVSRGARDTARASRRRRRRIEPG